jgi:hypothetical protein
MAKKLNAYMRFRASREGVAHEHSVDYFRRLPLDCAISGVVIHGGELIEDNQNAEAFADWRGLQ